MHTVVSQKHNLFELHVHTSWFCFLKKNRALRCVDRKVAQRLKLEELYSMYLMSCCFELKGPGDQACTIRPSSSVVKK